MLLQSWAHCPEPVDGDEDGGKAAEDCEPGKEKQP